MLFKKNQEDLLNFLHEHSVATIATVKDGLFPSATTVYYFTDNNCNLYFLTKDGSRKFINIDRNPNIAVVISNPETLETVQAEGKAQVVDYTDANNKKMVDDFMSSMAKKGNPWENLPINHVQKGYYALIKISPLWIRWTDFKDWEHTVQFEKNFE